MNKIKFRLYNEGNVVIFRVLEQSEDIRGSYDEQSYSYQSSNGFMIKSGIAPIIADGCVYIRGADKDCDDKVDILFLRNEKEALKYVKRALFAFEEWISKGYPFDNVEATMDEYDYINENDEDHNTYCF